jgi:glycosyltransferase involved in cell wall biosynthesis
MKLSIAIPTHEMPNLEFFLPRALDSLWNQTFQDFEIVVSDNSDDNRIEKVCDYYKTGIKYAKNAQKGMAPNTNEAMKCCEGELIKVLYMDDYMAHDSALEKIVNKFRGHWLVSGCEHDDGDGVTIREHRPKYSEDIAAGNNTIGSPSVLTVKNEGILYFDESMTWLLDCDLYKRYFDTYGPPTILNDINVIIGLGKHQMTNLMGDEIKLKEHEYIKNKHA